MRALSLEECLFVVGGTDGGSPPSGGGQPSGSGEGGGNTGGDAGGYPLTNPFPDDVQTVGDGGSWGGYYDEPWGSSGHTTSTGVTYNGDGWTISIGTIDDDRDSGSVDGAQVTVTKEF
jgi:hypothetical protein